MELINYFNRKGGFIFFAIALLFFACENNRSTQGLTEKTEEAADTFESNEADLEKNRERLTTYIENQISRNQNKIDSLTEVSQTASEKEKDQIKNQIERLESENLKLEQQQRNITRANVGELKQIENNIEEILHDYVETQVLDRGVRGEGTSLDGPDFNKTGTITGTEVEQNAPAQLEEAGAQSPAVPSGP